MNLIGDPWIPVIFEDGTNRLVSLNEAFERGVEIRDLAATPPQRIALTRLLVCIAQAGLDGPRDDAGWRGCRPRLAAASLDYLARHCSCFDLYGEGAFLQAPNLEATENAVVDKLDFALSAGNNATLFDHAASPEGRPQSPAWCALMLLTYQCFSPGGTIGISRWQGSDTSRSSDHAPCLEGSMLHTLLRGKCLLDTIHLNLITKETVGKLPCGDWGAPAWEHPPAAKDDSRAAVTTRSYLGRLVPVSRGVKLSPAGRKLTLVNGLSYPKLPEYREPSATVVVRRRGHEEEQAYLRVNLSRHAWRELASVLAYAFSTGQSGAFVLEHVREREGHGSVDLWTGGLAADKGKVLDVAEWSFHIPPTLLGSSALNTYEQGVALADGGAKQLAAAVGSYFEDLSVGEFARGGNGKFKRNDPRTRVQRRKVIDKATGQYWGQLDARYQVLVAAAATPEVKLGGGWYDTVNRAMEETYRRACPHETPRQIRAFAKGGRRIRLKRPED